MSELQANLKYYRDRAISILTDELVTLPEAAQAVDLQIEALVRLVSNQPASSNKDPLLAYTRVLGEGKSLKEYRVLAAGVIGLGIRKVATVSAHDGALDDLIRVLVKSPARPKQRGAYVGLIKPPAPVPVEVLFADKRFVLTEAQLLQIVVDRSPYTVGRVKLLLPHINAAMERFDITKNKLRVAHFLAQILHESGQLRYDTEIASGSAYEGRKDLGNIHPGDGKKFKGRGLIQITGRANVTAISKALNVDFVSNPALLSTPQYSAFGAAWFWYTHDLSRLADHNNLYRITRIINGGYNGLADRKHFLARAKKVLGLA